MAQFKFQNTVGLHVMLTTVLGASAALKFTDDDIGKTVKLGSAESNYVLAEDGDDIEGFVSSINVETKNDGFSLGGIQEEGTLEVEVEGGVLAVGAFVVAGTVSTLNTKATPLVKAGAGANFKWRVVTHLSGTGQIGETVLIRKV